jgi:hypothetical protein
MRYLRGFAVLCVVAIISAGCATPFGERLQSAVSIISSASAATVDPKVVIVAANAFDALEVTAKNYLKLPRCNGNNGPVCRSPAATQPLISAVRSGRVARRNAIAFLKAHPGELGPGGLYDALNTSILTIETIFRSYNIGGV